MIFPLFLTALIAGSQASMVSYEGYKVFRITPHNEKQLDVLTHIEKTYGFDVWKSTRMISKPWDIMVKPSMISNFESLLHLNKMSFQVLVENVEDILIKDIAVNNTRSGEINFQQYQRYDAMVAYMVRLVNEYPDTVSQLNIGQTSEGRDILGVRISSGGSNNPAILIDCGIHAREWMAPAQCLYIIQELVENAANHAMLRGVDWYIIPSLNPDGYEYTHTKDRMWRKTRSRGKSCDGVDANRNFGFHWNEIGASDWECDETYAGSRAFSEVETQALRDFSQTINNIVLYLTFHSYGSYLLYPWGYTSAYPENRKQLQSLGEEVRATILGVRGEEYTVGSSTNALYAAAGISIDWMMGVRGVPLCYTIELPGLRWGFQPPASEIYELVRETFEGVRVFADHVRNNYAKSNRVNDQCVCNCTCNCGKNELIRYTFMGVRKSSGKNGRVNDQCVCNCTCNCGKNN